MGRIGQLRALLAELPADSTGWNGRLEDLLRWLLAAPAQPLGPASPRTAALRELLRELRGHPQAEAWSAGLREALAHASAVRLLAETGIPGQPGVLGEVLDRWVNRVVPRMDAEEDLFALLDRLEVEDVDADWLETLAPEDREALAAFLPEAGVAVREALGLLAFRVAGLGLSRELLRLMGHPRDLDSPFARIHDAVRNLDAPGGWRDGTDWTVAGPAGRTAGGSRRPERLANRRVPRMDTEEDLFALPDRLELDLAFADYSSRNGSYWSHRYAISAVERYNRGIPAFKTGHLQVQPLQ